MIIQSTSIRLDIVLCVCYSCVLVVVNILRGAGGCIGVVVAGVVGFVVEDMLCLNPEGCIPS